MDFSQVAAPVTELTSPSIEFLSLPRQSWHSYDSRTVSGSAASDKVEVSDTAVLSQNSGPYLKVLLSPTVWNYDSMNRVLLAVKLAQGELRHRLEVVEQPFVVWIDHKNLAYVQQAVRLNSRQARWAVNFTVLFPPLWWLQSLGKLNQGSKKNRKIN